MTMGRKVCAFLPWLMAVILVGCGKETVNSEPAAEQSIVKENVSAESGIAGESDNNAAPSKEQVLAAREAVLEGMDSEQAERLTENIKTANLAMENAYLDDNIFEKLGDKDHLYWNYFDQKGNIQIGWAYTGELSEAEIREKCESENITRQEFNEKYGEPVMVYNRFDADAFIDLMEEMQESVQNEALKADLQKLAEEAALARDTHDAAHAENLYKVLHDMDYYLLRYGIEDVGKYTKDMSTVAKYYGALSVYQ